MNTLRDLWEEWGFAIVGAILFVCVFIIPAVIGLSGIAW